MVPARRWIGAAAAAGGVVSASAAGLEGLRGEPWPPRVTFLLFVGGVALAGTGAIALRRPREVSLLRAVRAIGPRASASALVLAFAVFVAIDRYYYRPWLFVALLPWVGAFLVSASLFGEAWGRALRTRFGRVLDLLLFDLALLLVLAEATLRAAGTFSSSPLFYQAGEDERRRIDRFHLRPGLRYLGARANSLGYLDGEFSRDVPGRVTVAVLGDSFAVGVVRAGANFVPLAEARLAREGRSFDLQNYGVVGVGPGGYLQVFLDDARRFSPDLVLVAFFVGNDFEEVVPPQWCDPEFYFVYSVPRRLLAIARGRGPRRAAGGRRSVGEEAPGPENAFPEETFLEIETARLAFLSAGDLQARFRRVAAILRRLRAASDGRLALVLIPDEFQVNPTLLVTLCARSGLRREGLDFDRPQRWLLEFGREERVPVLDLLPLLREAQVGEPVYRARDTHWNEAGNRLAADAIARFLAGLERSGFPDGRPLDRPGSE